MSRVTRNSQSSIHIIALGALGGGISGGDRIFIEFARRWSKSVPIHLYLWEEGLAMCRREKLKGRRLKIHLIKVGWVCRLGFVATYFYRIMLGAKLGFSLKGRPGDLVYSASEFWMDSLPALIFKLRNPKIKWAAAWYQTAPNPIRGFSEGKREKQYRVSALLYWFMQQPVKPLIRKFADFVLINNDFEKKQFPSHSKDGRAIVVLGAVNTENILKYLSKYKRPEEKKYLGVFQGRFHPQKGVVELIDIWKLVVDKIPAAKLAMIGDGPLMADVVKRIKDARLINSIDLYGYLQDGDLKYSIFSSSTVVLHPAFFDSGGMASAEAMAFGLPCIGFDLKSYKSYYPKGMVKVAVGDLESFAEKIIEIANNQSIYDKLSREAREMVFAKFSWEKRAAEVLSKINIKK